LCFVKNLPWLINNNLLLKIVKSSNCNIVCKNIECDDGLRESIQQWIRQCVTDSRIRGSIAPAFYEKLLSSKITNHEKTVKTSVFFALVESLWPKAVRKMLVKLIPDANFINILGAAFTRPYPKSLKKDWQLNCLFNAFGIFVLKSCALNVGEIDSMC